MDGSEMFEVVGFCLKEGMGCRCRVGSVKGFSGDWDDE